MVEREKSPLVNFQKLMDALPAKDRKAVGQVGDDIVRLLGGSTDIEI